MDDNELDKLFKVYNEADDVSDEAAEEAAEPVTEEALENEPSDESADPVEDEESEEKEDSEPSNNEEKDSEDSEEESEEADEGGKETSEDSEEEEKEPEEPEETESVFVQKEPPKVAKKPAPKKEKPHGETISLNKKSIAAICIAVALVVMVVLVLFLPAFRVRNAHIEGNVVLTDEEILREVGLEYDAHLMSGISGNIIDILRLDYGKTEERIKKENPYIEDIRITIQLPSTVYIKIKERSKVCYIRKSDHLRT